MGDEMSSAQGFILGIIIMLVVLIITSLSINIAKTNIAHSCELSGHIVIDSKAYKCELIKSPN
jgi:hypothetical protein